MTEDLDTFTLVRLLSEKSKEEIEFALVALMISNKIDFVNVSNSYVQTLKRMNEDNSNKNIEAHSSMMGILTFMRNKKKFSEAEDRAIQRCLYILNKSDSFNMQMLNEDLHYIGDEKAKEFSWYEKTKKIGYSD